MPNRWDDDGEVTGVYDPSRGSSAPPDESWYISRDGTSKEPLSAGQIIDQCQSGSITESTLVWREGLSDWAPLGEVPELAQALRAFSRAPGMQVPPPPIPPGQRPSLPSLPPPPSLPPMQGQAKRTTTTPPLRLSHRISSAIIDERKGVSLSGQLAAPLIGRPLSVFTLNEPYSIVVPGGRRVGVWSIAAGAGVLAVSMLLGAWIFGADEPDVTDQPPVVINLDAPSPQEEAPSATAERSGEAPKKSSKAEKHKPAKKKADPPPVVEESLDEAAEIEEDPKPKAPTAKATIDKDAVNQVLAKAADKTPSCAVSGGPDGAGKVRVLFTPSGSVAQVELLTRRFEDTKVGECVINAFMQSKIPPYDGGNVAVLKLFRVQ